MFAQFQLVKIFWLSRTVKLLPSGHDNTQMDRLAIVPGFSSAESPKCLGRRGKHT